MNTITFSHIYTKFPKGLMQSPIKQARLIQVHLTHSDNLSGEFINYDTKIEGGGYYKLPKGALLLLIFKRFESIFTTIRPWNVEKERYYKLHTGEIFAIKILKE